LYDALVRRKGLFSTVNAYILGSVDQGLFILSGQLLPTTSEEEAEEALLSEARMLCSSENISDYELEKVKNKFEANTLFGELNVMNKAMNLGFYEMLGDLEIINKEVDIFRSVTKEQVASFCRNTLTDSGCSTLIYRAKNR
ncbi:MAG: insulinase family protein, partial [Alistipes sp.]|nr:insulinase family protein [Alistipes sp.]